MALFNNGWKLGTGVAVGLGAIVLAPTILPILGAVAKPFVKAGIKSGMILYGRSREMIAEAAEVIEDLAAEAKAELIQTGEGGPASTPPASEGP